MTNRELIDGVRLPLHLTVSVSVGASVGAFGTYLKDSIREVVDFNNIAANCYSASNSGFCELLSNDSAPDAIQGFFVNAGLIIGTYLVLEPEERQSEMKSIIVIPTALIPLGMIAGEVVFSLTRGSSIRVEDVVTETIGAIGSAIVLGAIFHFGAKK